MKMEFIFIKKKDDFCQNIDQFKNLFTSNRKLSFGKDELLVEQKSVKYQLSFHEIEDAKEFLYELSLNAEDGTEDEQIFALESAEEALKRINNKLNVFEINTVWDDVSMYYGRKLYPQIIEVEALLRKIIYSFMLRNSGSKWLNKQSPEDFKKDIEQTAKKNQVELGEYNTDALIYANFNALGSFFFAKYPLEKDSQKLVRKLSDIKNMSEDEIQTLQEQFEIKSNWDRYFADKIAVDDLYKKWIELYAYRNMVAHTKKITRKDYEHAQKIIKELKDAFTKCLKELKDIKMTPEQTKAVEEVADQTIAWKIEYEKNDSDEFHDRIASIVEGMDSSELQKAINNVSISLKYPLPSEVNDIVKNLKTMEPYYEVYNNIYKYMDWKQNFKFKSDWEEKVKQSVEILPEVKAVFESVQPKKKTLADTSENTDSSN